MTLCAVCRARRSASMTDAGAMPRRGPGASAALLLRVWEDDDGVRARLLAPRDGAGPPASLAVAHGIEGICAAVRSWLMQTTARATPPS